MTTSREKLAKPKSQIQTHVVANRAALIAVSANNAIREVFTAQNNHIRHPNCT